MKKMMIILITCCREPSGGWWWCSLLHQRIFLSWYQASDSLSTSVYNSSHTCSVRQALGELSSFHAHVSVYTQRVSGLLPAYMAPSSGHSPPVISPLLISLQRWKNTHKFSMKKWTLLHFGVVSIIESRSFWRREITKKWTKIYRSLRP